MPDKVINAHIGAQVVSASMAGFSLTMFTAGYLTLFLIGAVAGCIAWFYKLTHADPKWTRWQATSEALKQVAISAAILPGAIDAFTPFLTRHGYNTFSVQILIGFLAAFMGVEIVSFLFEEFKKRVGGSK